MAHESIYQARNQQDKMKIGSRRAIIIVAAKSNLSMMKNSVRKPTTLKLTLDFAHHFVYLQ